MKRILSVLLLLVACVPNTLPGPDSCHPGVVCKQLTPNTFTIGSFNIQTFGQAKRSKNKVMSIIKDIVEDFDLVAVQEIRDSSGETPYALLEMLNSSKYGVVVSQRLGRTASKEQYAFYYDKHYITYLNKSFVFNDADDWFERPPFFAMFSINGIEYAFVDVHIKPEDAKSEISHLSDVVSSVNSTNVFVLGDFNADGTYLNEKLKPDITGMAWLIPDSFDTTVGKAFYTYDRIVGNTKAMQSGVYKFDNTYSLTYEEAKQVSDHYPIYVLLKPELQFK